MKVVETLAEWRELRRGLKGSLGFVPTMGALHEGHLSLLRRSRSLDDITVLSIYVNPTQFNDPNDLANYPDTLDEDLAAARRLGVDYVILPSYADMYADGYRYQVLENEFSLELCGGNRPGHFTGVLTVVMKLLNLVRPHRAYFGKKDYQQYLLIKDMCESLFMEVDIVGCETVRECDGLAMSSRNKLLDAKGRRLASRFNVLLASNDSDTHVIESLAALGFTVDYVVTRGKRRFGAVLLEGGERTVRLIDNVELPHHPKNDPRVTAEQTTTQVA
ncbi:MAG: pantoate--beta-alanine ligase [Pseudomonadota bacterium]